MAIDQDWLISEADTSTATVTTWSTDPLSVFTGLPDKDQSAEIFYKTVPGRKDVLQDVDSKLSPQGDLKQLTGIDVIIRSLITLFMTPTKTYIMDPEFGIGIHKYLWEPATESTREQILALCKEATRRYEDRAQIEFNVEFFRDRKSLRLDCMITYDGENKEISIEVDENFLRTID